jgi:anaerobic selenocysteine-containing dehydrogenase
MALSRRQFLKWAGVTGVGAVVFNGCRVPDHEIEVQSPLELPEDLVTGRDNYYATVARIGGASEGLLVRVMEGRAKKIEGNPDYPLNGGKHGLWSEALLQETYHPDRISSPLARIAKGGPFRKIGWPEAIERLTTILGEADPASVLLATDPIRGRLANVVNRFSTGYGSRLAAFDPADQTVLREAIRRVYGQSALPDFDIANADYVMSFGADFLGTWLDPTRFSVGYGQFRQGREGRRGRLVHVDSRFSLTAAAADEWLPVRPGAEGLLAMAMIHTIVRQQLGDREATDALTGGQGVTALSRFQPSSLAAAIGIPAARIIELGQAFGAAGKRSLAIGGGSAAAHTNGLFSLTAIYALNHLVGSVNRPGGVIFNPSSLLSAIEGLPLRQWRAELGRMRSGDTKVVLVRNANIAYGLPKEVDATGALGSVDTIVSFSSFLDETTAMADLILPGSTALEEWGSDTPDPGPGFTTVAFQQPVINRFHDTLAFGDVLLRVGKAVGLERQLPWENMREAVRASALDLHKANRGSVAGMSTFEEFWKRALERGGWFDKGETYDGDAPVPAALPRTPVAARLIGTPDFNLTLVPYESQGIRAGQFAHLPWAQSVPDPLTTAAWSTWVDLNPSTARTLNVKQDDVVTVESSTGRHIDAIVYVNPATPPGIAAIPLGQGHEQFTSYASGRGSNVLDIVAAAEDEETGALAWAATRVRVVKTHRRQNLPKLEGIELAIQLPHENIIEIQRG